MMKTRLFDRIGDVAPSVWDGTGSDPLSAHAVLSAIEGSGMAEVAMRYAVIEDSNGRVLACAPFARIPIDAARLTHGPFRASIETVRRVFPGLLRTSLAICGAPLSVGNPPVRIAAGIDARPILIECAGLLRETAEDWGAPWRAFKEFPADGVRAGRVLEREGWTIAPSEPNAGIAIRWESFDGYVASLRHPYRRKIRLSARKLARAGIRVEVSSLREAWEPSLHLLYERVFERAEVQLERLPSAFFASCGRALGESMRLIRFLRQGRTIGWVALITDHDRVIDLFHGIDYDENAAADLYFNQLAETIRFAIERGARFLSLGQSTETAKGRFGAVSVPLWIALRHESDLLNGALHHGAGFLFPAKKIHAPRVFHDAPSPAARRG